MAWMEAIEMAEMEAMSTKALAQQRYQWSKDIDSNKDHNSSDGSNMSHGGKGTNRADLEQLKIFRN